MPKSKAIQSASERLDLVRHMMWEIMCDQEWLSTDLEELEKWIDLGPLWAPNDQSTRELCEQLIENSVGPEHCRRRS